LSSIDFGGPDKVCTTSYQTMVLGFESPQVHRNLYLTSRLFYVILILIRRGVPVRKTLAKAWVLSFLFDTRIGLGYKRVG
jgi:hypothetical protein